MFQLRSALPYTADQNDSNRKNALAQPKRDVAVFHVKHHNWIPANNSREDNGCLGRRDQRKLPFRQAAHASPVALAMAMAPKPTNGLGTFHVKRRYELASAEARLSQNGQNAIQITDCREIYCDLAFSCAQIDLDPGVETISEVFGDLIEVSLAPTRQRLHNNFLGTSRRCRLRRTNRQVLLDDLVGPAQHAGRVPDRENGASVTRR